MSDKTHPIPNAESNPENLEGMAIYDIEEYQVAEWCPTPDGTGPAEQVHVLFKLKSIGPPLVLRFKSDGELDRFIAVLTRHRLGVWPQGE